MGNNNKVERLFLTDGDNLLKFSQGCAVLTKIIAELIPDKNNLNVIFIDNIYNPPP